MKKKLKTFEFASLKRSVVVAGKKEILKVDRNVFARLTVIAQFGPIPWSVTATEEAVAKTARSKIVEVLQKTSNPWSKIKNFLFGFLMLW